MFLAALPMGHAKTEFPTENPTDPHALRCPCSCGVLNSTARAGKSLAERQTGGWPSSAAWWPPLPAAAPTHQSQQATSKFGLPGSVLKPREARASYQGCRWVSSEQQACLMAAAPPLCHAERVEAHRVGAARAGRPAVPSLLSLAAPHTHAPGDSLLCPLCPPPGRCARRAGWTGRWCRACVAQKDTP